MEPDPPPIEPGRGRLVYDKVRKTIVPQGKPDAEIDRLRADNARLVTEREAERERCAKIAEDWLTTFGDQKPQHVTAQTWACDAVRDIAQLIRSGQP